MIRLCVLLLYLLLVAARVSVSVHYFDSDQFLELESCLVV